jgi:hypothetical protein
MPTQSIECRIAALRFLLSRSSNSTDALRSSVQSCSAIRNRHAVSGIGPSGDPARLIGVLQNLGLCPPDLAAPLKKLAAVGRPVNEFYQVSVWDLDRALQDVDCSIQNRLQFKASLDRAGLLSVPK